MSQPQAGEKTEKPTPKRQKEARKEGQIARTNDLGGWLVVLSLTWLGPMLVRSGYEQCAAMLRSLRQLSGGGQGIAAAQGDMLGFLGEAVMRGVVLLVPLMALAMVVGVGSQVAQIGWAPKKMKPDLKKLNPIKGIKGMFGMRLVWESAKNVFKLMAIVLMALAPIQGAYEVLVTSGTAMNVPAVAGLIAEATMGFLRNVALLGLVIAAADYLQSKKQTDKQVKMSKQEVKEEHKQTEGDPHVKGQIRQRQMAMSRNRMMAEVPKADVVVVNPTHIAVALRYDPAAGAPKVLAKGAGPLADRIRELAAEGEVPVVRDVPLARTVYRLVEVDQAIPVELYEAVARVLAFVYALRSRGRAAGVHTSPFAEVHESLTALERRRGRRREAAPA